MISTYKTLTIIIQNMNINVVHCTSVHVSMCIVYMYICTTLQVYIQNHAY